MFGPCTVTENAAEIKLYNFLKSSIPSLSKRQLREHFKDGNITVNGAKIREGHIDEMKRLHEGDVIEICPDNCTSKSTKFDSIEIDVLHTTPEFIIIVKLSGVSVSPSKEFEQALKYKLWNGKHKDTCRLIYHLEKSLNGLCIIVRNASTCKQLRGLMVCGAESKPPVNSTNEMVTCSYHSVNEKSGACNNNNTMMTEPDQQQQQQPQPQIALTYRAIVCGFLGEPGSTIELHTKYHEVPILHIHILSVSHCRSHNFLSLIDIQPLSFDAHKMGCSDLSQYTLTNDPKVAHIRDKHHMHTEEYLKTLENPVTGGDVKMDNYPTRYLKQIKYALAHAGHPIVGDGNVVKKNKGIHAALVKISIFSKPVYSGTNDAHDASGDVTAVDYKHRESIKPEKETGEKSADVSSAAPKGVILSTEAASHQPETDSSYPITVEIPTPEKFAKLLQREERLWQLAKDRDDNVLLEFNERETRGRKGTTTVQTDVGASSSSDATATVNDNSCVQYNAQNNVTTSCSEDDINGADKNAGVLSKCSEDDMRDSDMPVEYRTNEASFCDTVFFVNPHVMIPRKSSETLVKEAVRLLTLPVNTAGNMKPTCEHMADHANLSISSIGCDTVRAMEATRPHGMPIPLQSTTTNSTTTDMCHSLNTIDALTNAAMSTMLPVNATVLDLGTGSGCLLLSCLQKLKQHNDMAATYHAGNMENYSKVTGVGVDISVDALEVARENARQLGLNSNDGQKSGATSMVQFVEGSFESLLPVLLSLQKKGTGCDDAGADVSSVVDCDVNLTVRNNSNDITHNATHSDTQTNARTSTVSSCTQEVKQAVPPFDIILCNPPYSTKKDRTRLSQCTKVYEPDVALYAPRSVSVHVEEKEVDDSSAATSTGDVSGDVNVASKVDDVRTVNNRDHSGYQHTALADERRSASSDDTSHTVSSGLARGDKSEKKLIGGSMGAYHMIARSIRDIHKYQVSLLPSQSKNSSQAAVTVDSGEPCSDSVEKKGTTVSVMDATKSAVTSGPSIVAPVGLLFKDGAYLILEMGFGQEKQVKSIFSSVKCLEFVHSVKDHLGLVRGVVYKYCLEVSVAKSGLI